MKITTYSQRTWNVAKVPVTLNKFSTHLTDVDPVSSMEDDFNQVTAVFIQCLVTEIVSGLKRINFV
jgi:hypothetical protein